jgi:L-arabinose isomerase
MAGIEMVVIGPASTVADVQKELRWNEAYYGRR